MDELSQATTGQRVATGLLAGVMGPLCFLAAWKLVGKVTDVGEDAPVVVGAVLLALLGVATGFIAAIAVRPSLARHKVVAGPILVILALMALAYRLWFPW